MSKLSNQIKEKRGLTNNPFKATMDGIERNPVNTVVSAEVRTVKNPAKNKYKLLLAIDHELQEKIYVRINEIARLNPTQKPKSLSQFIIESIEDNLKKL